MLVVGVSIGTAPKRKNAPLAQFLQANPLAKIVIIVDSHSSQDGQIVTRVEGDHTYSDYLGEVSPGDSCLLSADQLRCKVLKGCLPKEIWEIIDSEAEKQHDHQVLVVNGTCGQSILNDGAREHFLSGYVGKNRGQDEN